MGSKIIIALRRHYHCVHARAILEQNALSYPVYELNDSEESVDILRRAIRQGAEVLITGSMYAEPLMQQLNISVVAFRRSRIPFDSAIREALALSRPAAIVWRESESAAAIKACRNFPSLVSFFPFTNLDELDAIFRKLNEANFRIVIGSGQISPFAEQYGMTVINVPYDEEDILSAVHLAEHNLHMIEQNQEQTEILNTIQDNISEGIIYLNLDGTIRLCNAIARRQLGLPAKSFSEHPLNIKDTEIYGEEIRQLLLSRTEFSGKIFTAGGSQIVLEGRPVIVHNIFRSAILTISGVNRIQEIEQQVRKQLTRKEATASISFSDIVGNSPALLNAIRKAKRYAQVDSAILVYGQSGTGKEMFVQSIHNASLRKQGPFVVINCAALPENLIESELFGYEKGAFTGALKEGKEGLFVQGDGGTVFLDEISEMPLNVQARFLRVLQEHEVTPVGSLRTIPVNFRVIAATNKDLRRLVEEKKFREDLYYRISVLTINLPPLAARTGDVELLIRHFIRLKQTSLHLDVAGIQPNAMHYLCSLNYPGNIRQLSNVVERAMVLSSGQSIDLAAALEAAQDGEMASAPAPNKAVASTDGPVSSADHNASAAKEGIEYLQKDLIQDTLRRCGNRKDAAGELGISVSTLYRRMKKLGLE